MQIIILNLTIGQSVDFKGLKFETGLGHRVKEQTKSEMCPSYLAVTSVGGIFV